MKKPTKERTKGKDAFTVTEVGTLIEHFESEFKIFGERQSSIIEKLDATYEEVGRNSEDIALLKVAFKNMATKEDLTKMATKEDLRMLTEKVDKNTEAIAMLVQKVDELTRAINNLVKTKADHEEFLTLEKRVSTLENKVATLS